jgi:CheY-like chemotaxis protein
MSANIEILVVDDDKEDSHMIQYSMKEAQVDNPVRFIYDGLELVEYLKICTDAARPGIILLDLNMPKISGHDLLVKLKEHPGWKRIPVIVFSTSNFKDDVERAYTAGAAGYMVKPIKYERFVAMIRMLRDYWFDCVILSSE